MRNLFLIVAICALTIVAVLFWDAPPELFFLDNETRVEAMPTADSYMRNTRTRKYDDKGGLAYVLTAETGLYYSTDDRFQLEQPRLVARDAAADGNPWHLTAKAARSAERGDTINLTGDVHAWQAVPEGRNEFFTDDILFLPGDNTARTESRVKLVHPEGTTTGTGMKADFTAETYRLLADVRGYYHVN